MRTYNVTEDLILEAHKEACDKWKKKIEGIAPELFKPKFKVGDWVIFDCRVHKSSPYRIIEMLATGDGKSEEGHRDLSLGNYRLATKEEIEKHLIAEAKKRGFKAGVRVFYIDSDSSGIIQPNYYHEYNLQEDSFNYHNIRVYLKGKWATILPAEKVRLTLEDIAKLKGVDVSLIEIVK